MSLLFTKPGSMEIKRNEATMNRPEGDRVIDAPFVFIDIPAFMQQLQQEKAWESNDRNGITVFKSTDLTVVITTLQAGATIKDNEVASYLILQVVKGQARISTSEGDVDLSENQLIALHPFVTHTVAAITDVTFLLSTYSIGKKIPG